MQWKLWPALGMLSIVTLAGCTTIREPMDSGEKSLYERLGGKPAITAVVDDFTARLAADRRVNRFFAHTDLPTFRAKLVDQICEASGGPCKYTGRDMQTAHQGLGVANADFDMVVEDLVITLDKFKIPDREKSEILAVVGPMRKDIVMR
jgi:hemoglobin